MVNPQVSIIMGSDSDWLVMQAAAKMLDQFGIVFEKRVVFCSSHPCIMVEFSESAASRGIKCIIAGAGGAAHLPGMVAAMTTVPVLGVPIPSKHLSGTGLTIFYCANAKGCTCCDLCDR